MHVHKYRFNKDAHDMMPAVIYISTYFLMASAFASMKGPKSASVSVSRLCHGILHACPKGLWCQHSTLYPATAEEKQRFSLLWLACPLCRHL
jgi:hypothetical protein